MPRSPFNSNPIIVRLPSLVKEIASGGIQIPRFQRPFEWSNEQRLTLLDSVVKGLPIGSLLTWKTDLHKVASYDNLGPFVLQKPPEVGTRTYLLDGHQRVATLYGALQAPSSISDADDETELANGVRWPIYYDLEKPSFRLAPRGQKSIPPTWLRLSALFDGEALWSALAPLREAQRSDLARRATALAETFAEYQIPIVPILSEDLALVIESFRRVNSQGTKMSEVFMVRALIWSPEFDLLSRFQRIIEDKLAPLGWGELEPQELLDALKVFGDLNVYTADAEQLSMFAKDDANIKRFTDCMERAISFLRDHCDILGPSLLPYRYQFACLMAAARTTETFTTNEATTKSLVKWFWTTTYQEYFGGAMDRQIREAAELVQSLVSESANPLSHPSPTWLLMPLRSFHLKSARTRAMVLLLLRQQPQDAQRASKNLARQVFQLGGQAIPKIIRTAELVGHEALSDSPGNRWIALPDKVRAMEKLLRSESVRPEFLQSHCISPEAAQAYREKRYADFINYRAKTLFEKEWVFTSKVGLTRPGMFLARKASNKPETV